jgi:hypothetical protein
MLVFWVVTPCGLVGRYQRIGGTYCLHLQPCVRIEKTNIVIFNAVRTSNLNNYSILTYFGIISPRIVTARYVF